MQYAEFDPDTGEYYDAATGQTESGAGAINPDTGQVIPSNNNTSTGTTPVANTSPAAPDINVTPDWLSNNLPGGQTPTYTPSQVGGIPTINAPFTQTNTAGPAATSNLDLSNANLNGQIMSGLAPQFNQQNRALTEALANAGIVGGSTTGAVGNLALQQQQQAQAALTGADQQQEGLALNQSQGNASAINQGNQYNTSATNQGNQFNTQQNLAAQSANQNAGINTGEFNATQNNAGAQQNIANELNSAQYQAGQGTAANQFAAQLANNNWLANLQSQTNLATNGASNETSAFQPNYIQPPTVNYGGLAGAAAPNPNTTNAVAAGGSATRNTGFDFSGIPQGIG